MKAGIKGIGVVGGFGCGISDFEQALDRSRSETQTISIGTVKGTIEVPGLMADTPLRTQPQGVHSPWK